MNRHEYVADRQRQNINKDMRKKMSNLEKLKQDMDEKRKTADDAYAAYAEAALEQAPATTDVTISRGCATRLLSLVRENKAETPYGAEFENWGSLLNELKAALEGSDE